MSKFLSLLSAAVGVLHQQLSGDVLQVRNTCKVRVIIPLASVFAKYYLYNPHYKNHLHWYIWRS